MSSKRFVPNNRRDSTVKGATKQDNTAAVPGEGNWYSPDYGYTTKQGKTVYTNPAGLGEILGRTPIEGAWDLLGGGPNTEPAPGFNLLQSLTPQQVVKKKLTADQVMWLFEHTTPQQLALIQQKMYFAGMYGKHVPQLGVFQKADKDAFRTMLIGLASSPDQGPVGGYLDTISKAGVQGTTRAPLVVKIASPDELRTVFQAVSQKLQGQFMPQDEVDRMIATYQQMQTKAQTDAYNMGDTSLTGVLDGGAGGTVTTPPAADAFAEAQLRNEHPNQVAGEEFGNKMQVLLNAFTKPVV